MNEQKLNLLRHWLHDCLGNDSAVGEFEEWFPTADLDRHWEPTDEDRTAAWKLFTEMRTRVVAQRMHYRNGDEKTALKSLHSLFQICRDIVAGYARL